MEDECETSETEEMEDKEFQSPVGQEDDDEDELTGLQPKRVSRSHNQFSSGAVKQEPAEGNKAALLIKSEHQHSSQKII